MAGRQEKSPQKSHSEREQETPKKHGSTAGASVGKRRSKSARPPLVDAGAASNRLPAQSPRGHEDAARGAVARVPEPPVEAGGAAHPPRQYLTIASTPHSLILKRVQTLPPGTMRGQGQQFMPGRKTADKSKLLLAVPLDQVPAFRGNYPKTRTQAAYLQNLSQASGSENGARGNDSQNGRPVCANCIGSPTKDIELPPLFTFGEFTNDILLY